MQTYGAFKHICVSSSAGTTSFGDTPAPATFSRVGRESLLDLALKQGESVSTSQYSGHIVQESFTNDFHEMNYAYQEHISVKLVDTKSNERMCPR
jgi:hypothetical protein